MFLCHFEFEGSLLLLQYQEISYNHRKGWYTCHAASGEVSYTTLLYHLVTDRIFRFLKTWQVVIHMLGT